MLSMPTLLSIWSTLTHLECTLQSPYAHSFCPVFVSIARITQAVTRGGSTACKQGSIYTLAQTKFQIIPCMVHPRKYEGETFLAFSIGSTTQPYQG